MFEQFETISTLLQPGVLIPEEYFKYFSHLPSFVYGFLAAFILTPIIGYIAKKIGATYKPMQKQKDREFDNAQKAIHEVETPALGGMAITIPLFIFIIVTYGFTEITIPLLIALGILILNGILDDVIVIPSTIQLLLQTLAAVVIAFSSINLASVNNPFGGLIDLNWGEASFNFIGIFWQFIFPGDLLLIAWILICNISMKVVGGSPALIESNSFIAFVLLFILGVRTTSDFVTVNSIFIAGSLLGLIIFAFPPEKIFSGASGKGIYGFLIAIFAIINGAKFATTLLIILMPIIDFSFVLIKRMIVHKIVNPFKLMKISDTNHLHHQLIALGFSRRKVLLIETSITLLIGSIAVFSTGAFKFFFIIFSFFILVTGILIVHWIKNRFDKKKAEPVEEKSPEAKYVY